MVLSEREPRSPGKKSPRPRGARPCRVLSRPSASSPRGRRENGRPGTPGFARRPWGAQPSRRVPAVLLRGLNPGFRGPWGAQPSRRVPAVLLRGLNSGLPESRTPAALPACAAGRLCRARPASGAAGQFSSAPHPPGKRKTEAPEGRSGTLGRGASPVQRHAVRIAGQESPWRRSFLRGRDAECGMWMEGETPGLPRKVWGLRGSRASRGRRRPPTPPPRSRRASPRSSGCAFRRRLG